jgi:hypothetical protein
MFELSLELRLKKGPTQPEVMSRQLILIGFCRYQAPVALTLFHLRRGQGMADEAINRPLEGSLVLPAFRSQKSLINEGIDFRFVQHDTQTAKTITPSLAVVPHPLAALTYSLALKLMAT